MVADALMQRPRGVAEHSYLRSLARILHHELKLTILPIHHPEAPVPEYLRASWDDDQHAGKRVLVSWKSFQEERPTSAQVESWFAGCTPHNIAIVTGRASGVNVVDLDSPAAWAWAESHLPSTPMRATTSEKAPGFFGEHWYYRADPDHPMANRCKLRTSDAALDLDIRGQGGYVIAPGSLHKSGIRYRLTAPWNRDLLEQLPALDPSLVAPLMGPPPVVPRVEYTGSLDRLAERARRWLAKRSPAIEGSGGDARTYITAAFLLNDFALPEDVAWSLLLEWNRGCDPPWQEQELRVKFDSAKRSPHRGQTFGRLRDAQPPMQRRASSRQRRSRGSLPKHQSGHRIIVEVG